MVFSPLFSVEHPQLSRDLPFDLGKTHAFVMSAELENGCCTSDHDVDSNKKTVFNCGIIT